MLPFFFATLKFVPLRQTKRKADHWKYTPLSALAVLVFTQGLCSSYLLMKSVRSFVAKSVSSFQSLRNVSVKRMPKCEYLS